MQRTTEVALPTLRVVPNPYVGSYGRVESIGWTLPVDDTHYRIYTAGRVREKGVFLPKGIGAATNRKRWADMTPEERREFPGDWEAQVGQGAITFHSDEHLATSDQGILMLRRMLQQPGQCRGARRGSDRRQLRSRRAADRLRGRQLRRRRLIGCRHDRPEARRGLSAAAIMDDRRSLPIALLRAREAVMAYFRPHHRKGGITEQQWRVIRVLYLDGEMDARRWRSAATCWRPACRASSRTSRPPAYLVRRPATAIRASSLMSLSPKGTAIVTGAAPFLDRIHREIARRFGPARVGELLALLDELERALADPPSAARRQKKSGEEAANDHQAPACGLGRPFPAAVRDVGEAQARYDPGVSDSEIKLGQTAPYSGPVSAYGTFGRASVAYFAMINEQGGVNGRKITLLTADDGFSPPKAVEQVRKLVEADGVFAMFAPVGTATNVAVRKYLNDRKVPQLLLQSGISKFNDPKNFPWSLSGLPNYETEVKAFAKHILAVRPQGKVAILYQNDDFGKEYLAGLKDGLGARAKEMIAGEQSFELTDPTVESQVIALRGSGADVLLIVATQKQTVQALRKAHRSRLASAVADRLPCGLDHAHLCPGRPRSLDRRGVVVGLHRSVGSRAQAEPDVQAYVA